MFYGSARMRDNALAVFKMIARPCRGRGRGRGCG